jgi:HPt (histidine-containing phosphotransfer) domain-containing protein
MPNMDGFELTAAIREAEPAGSRLPIIAVTANAMQGEAQRCKDYGMDDYLSKPLRMDELAQMLTRWLPKAASAEAGQHTRAEPPETPPTQASVAWDPDTLGRLVGENADMQRRLLAKFLVNAQNQVQTMDSARILGDLRVLADVAHTLKSAARTVGAMALGELCQTVETAGRAGDLHGCLDLVQALPGALSQAAEEINRHLSQ